MDPFIPAAIVFLVSVFIARFVMERGNRLLEDELKAKLVTIFAPQRPWRLAAITAFVVLYLLNSHFGWLEPSLSALIYAILLLLYTIFSALVSVRTLKAAGFPGDYIRFYLTSTAISLTGLILFFALVAFKIFL